MGTFNNEVGGRLIAYFKKKLGAYDYKNGWIKSDCPHCGKEDKFGVHIGKDKTNCFVCNVKDKPLDLILQLEGLTTRQELFAFIRNLEDVDPFQSQIEKYTEKEVELPEGFKLLNQGNGIIAEHARSYMRGRGFNTTTLAMKGIGYCMKGEYKGCIILPFFTQGKLIYLLGRKMFASDAKFKNPEVQTYGIGKGQIIYNQDALYYYDEVHLVESYINALTLGDKAVASLGKIITPYQKSIILRSPVKRINIILDPDAWEEALKLGMDFCSHKQVRIIQLPEGTDVNDLGKKETRKLIKAAKVLKYQQIYKMWLFETERKKYAEANQA